MPDAEERRSTFKRILDLLKRPLGKNPASPAIPTPMFLLPCDVARKGAAAPLSPRSKMIPSAAFLGAADNNSPADLPACMVDSP